MPSKRSGSRTAPTQASLGYWDDSYYNLPLSDSVVGDAQIATANSSAAQYSVQYRHSPSIKAGAAVMKSELERQKNSYMSLLAEQQAESAREIAEAKRKVDTAMREIEKVRTEAYAQVEALKDTLDIESWSRNCAQRKLISAIARQEPIEHENKELKSEIAHLRAALAAMGIEYAVSKSNGGRVDSQNLELRFDARTARIVEDFANGVNGTLERIVFSSPTRPVEFFSALEAALDGTTLELNTNPSKHYLA